MVIDLSIIKGMDRRRKKLKFSLIKSLIYSHTHNAYKYLETQRAKGKIIVQINV